MKTISIIALTLMLSGQESGSVLNIEDLNIERYTTTEQQLEYYYSIGRQPNNGISKTADTQAFPTALLRAIKLDYAGRDLIRIAHSEWVDGKIQDTALTRAINVALLFPGMEYRDSKNFPEALRLLENLQRLRHGDFFEIEAIKFKASVYCEMGKTNPEMKEEYLNTEAKILAQALDHPSLFKVPQYQAVRKHMLVVGRLAEVVLNQKGDPARINYLFESYFQKGISLSYFPNSALKLYDQYVAFLKESEQLPKVSRGDIEELLQQLKEESQPLANRLTNHDVYAEMAAVAEKNQLENWKQISETILPTLDW